MRVVSGQLYCMEPKMGNDTKNRRQAKKKLRPKNASMYGSSDMEE